MPSSTDASRREFISGVARTCAGATSAALLAGCTSAGMAGPSTGGRIAASAAQPANAWDMSWSTRLRRYKTAYDSPEIQSGAALAYAFAAWAGYDQMAGTRDTDFTPVLILRHKASAMVLNDSLWARLSLGDMK